MFAANVFVEKVSNLSKTKNEAQFDSLTKELCEQQFVLVRNTKEAVTIGPACENLVSLTDQKFGHSHRFTLLAKMQLVWNYNFQDRRKDAVVLSESILPALKQKFGENSDEVFWFIQNLIILYRNLGRKAEADILARTQIEKHRQANPICEHLKPIEDYLLLQGAKIELRVKNKLEGTIQINVNAWLNCTSIREKLKIDSCVEKFEHHDVKSQSYRGFLCSIHRDSIQGFYESDLGWPVIE
jgi:hypothetical protein